MSTPARPIRRSACTKHDILFLKTHAFLFRLLARIYYVIRTTHKYRLDHLNWNKTSHVCLKMVLKVLLASRLRRGFATLKWA
ncbi:hypothetical protein HYC85_030562 [Camellia sinensis]|uniref:Uncharacterized protein n=1 Tax=Camellia sinensis TaxID=4442 RepID=A0A7J7G2R9_CAMSI|nr:hypothetical protein HYC85_030562 [Camellia sinensis]